MLVSTPYTQSYKQHTEPTMHTSVVVVLALAAVVAARPQQFQQQQQRSDIGPAIKRTEVRDDFNQVSLSYATQDGTSLTEHGALKQVTEGEHAGDYVLAKQGSYRYTSPEGKVIMVTWIADENGFQAVSDSIPVPVAPTA